MMSTYEFLNLLAAYGGLALIRWGVRALSEVPLSARG